MISPSTNSQRNSPLAHNPLLSSSSLPRHYRSNMMRRHQHYLTKSLINTSDDKQELSASIPLPKSHIHRTPSELQLADDTKRAEYEDVRMYARLVVGMQVQCINSGYVHPLTRKSLQDILRTKQAEDDELEKSLQEHDQAAADDQWEFSFAEEENENGSVDTPLPCHPMGTSRKAPTIVKTPSNGSIISNLSNNAPPKGIQDEEDDGDDECLFSLEL